MTAPYSTGFKRRRGQRNTAAVALVLARHSEATYDDLIDESGASRFGVRAALLRLEDDGLVTQRHDGPHGTRRTNFAVVIGSWCQR